MSLLHQHAIKVFVDILISPGGNEKNSNVTEDKMHIPEYMA